MWPGPDPAGSPVPPAAVAEIERRLRWRLAPLALFVAFMIGLGAAAAASLLAPRRTVSGIPVDADTRAAFALVRAQPPPAMDGLRFRSELTGEAEPGARRRAPAASDEARKLLERAAKRLPMDARLPAAIAHLDLARGAYSRAERGYRRALILAPHYGEARLGLGVTLARRAETEAEPLERRSLRLQAIAQFAAVPEGDPVHAQALYDRVILLAQVGRRAEAGRRARDYLRDHGGDAWAESLASTLGGAEAP